MRILLLSEADKSAMRLQKSLKNCGESVEKHDWPKTEDPRSWPPVDATILHGEDDRVVAYIEATRERIGKAALLMLAPLSYAGRLQALEYGADECVSIDIGIQQLHQRLLALRAISPATLHVGHCLVGDLHIGLSSIDVWRAGQHLNLGVREYQLLRLMGLNAGRTLSRGELVERIWGTDTDFNDNVLDVYIHRLRTKVDKPFDKCLLKTVRGVGYRLSDL